MKKKYGANVDVHRIDAHGEEVGIKFNASRLMVNSIESHRLVHYANERGKSNEVVEKIMKKYFVEGGNINDLATLVSLGEACGLEGVKAYMESGQDRGRVQEEDMEAKMMGVTGVPFFIISREGVRKKMAFSGAHPVETFVKVFENLEALAQKPQEESS